MSKNSRNNLDKIIGEKFKVLKPILQDLARRDALDENKLDNSIGKELREILGPILKETELEDLGKLKKKIQIELFKDIGVSGANDSRQKYLKEFIQKLSNEEFGVVKKEKGREKVNLDLEQKLADSENVKEIEESLEGVDVDLERKPADSETIRETGKPSERVDVGLEQEIADSETMGEIEKFSERVDLDSKQKMQDFWEEVNLDSEQKLVDSETVSEVEKPSEADLDPEQEMRDLEIEKGIKKRWEEANLALEQEQENLRQKNMRSGEKIAPQVVERVTQNPKLDKQNSGILDIFKSLISPIRNLITNILNLVDIKNIRGKKSETLTVKNALDYTGEDLLFTPSLVTQNDKRKTKDKGSGSRVK